MGWGQRQTVIRIKNVEKLKCGSNGESEKFLDQYSGFKIVILIEKNPVDKDRFWIIEEAQEGASA